MQRIRAIKNAIICPDRLGTNENRKLTKEVRRLCRRPCASAAPEPWLLQCLPTQRPWRGAETSHIKTIILNDVAMTGSGQTEEKHLKKRKRHGFSAGSETRPAQRRRPDRAYGGDKPQRGRCARSGGFTIWSDRFYADNDRLKTKTGSGRT
jgi:hypothetical protein